MYGLVSTVLMSTIYTLHVHFVISCHLAYLSVSETLFRNVSTRIQRRCGSNAEAEHNQRRRAYEIATNCSLLHVARGIPG